MTPGGKNMNDEENSKLIGQRVRPKKGETGEFNESIRAQGIEESLDENTTWGDTMEETKPSAR